jgi:cytochrome P450
VQAEDDISWKYSVKDVSSMMRNILFAGHETTAGAICVMMQFLTKNPAVMGRVREEQAALVAQHGEHLTPAILDGTYTEATAVEVRPPNPNLLFQLGEATPLQGIKLAVLMHARFPLIMKNVS